MPKVFKMKISREGYNVLTADPKDLIMSVEYNMVKTKLTGTSVGVASVAHGLGYPPIFLTSRQSGGNGACVGDDPTTTSDTTNINVGATTKYYVFFNS